MNKQTTIVLLILGLLASFDSMLIYILGLLSNNLFLGNISCGILILISLKFVELSGVLK